MAETTVTNGAEAQQSPSFPVYLVYSRKSLGALDALFSGFGEAPGLLRIVYDNEGAETMRTIAVLQPSVYEALVAAGYGDRESRKGVTITPFILKENHLPGEGRTKALFVPVPGTFNKAEDEETAKTADVFVEEFVNGKLEHLAQWGIVPTGSWRVHAPLKSRETGEVRGCFITFAKEVPLESIAMVRILMTDTYWFRAPNNEPLIFRCFWARDRKPVGRADDKALVPTTEEREAHKKAAIQKIAVTATPRRAPTVPLRPQPTVVRTKKPAVILDSDPTFTTVGAPKRVEITTEVVE